MKLLIKSLCIAFVLTVIYSVIPFQAECEQISNEVFRLHILANSDSEEDQSLKLRVRDSLLRYTDRLFSEAENSDEAERIARDNLESLRAVAQREVYANGYDYQVKAEVVNMYFNTRYYERYTMPAGMYDALRITIGSGEGHNWWCVMYPSICISSAVETDKRVEDTFSQNQQEIVKGNEYQYKFKVVEIFEKIVSLFE
ncbi:MAG: stage II sporulation protein R [Ruminococcus sp.]